MRRHLLLLLLLCECFTISQAQRSQAVTDLAQSYVDIQLSKTHAEDSIAQCTYFQRFPNLFHDFLVCFGASRYINYRDNLFTERQLYLQQLATLSQISMEQKAQKLIGIMVGGYWQPAGAEELMTLVHQLMGEHPQTFFAQLSSFSPLQQQLFWQCYWQSPQKEVGQEQQLQQFQHLKAFSNERAIMLKAYQTFRGQAPVEIDE